MSFREGLFNCCHECGIRYCNRLKPESYFQSVKYVEGKCNVCLKTKQITDTRHYGYLPLLTETRLLGEREFPEILRESERLAEIEGRKNEPYSRTNR